MGLGEFLGEAIEIIQVATTEKKLAGLRLRAVGEPGARQSPASGQQRRPSGSSTGAAGRLGTRPETAAPWPGSRFGIDW